MLLFLEIRTTFCHNFSVIKILECFLPFFHLICFLFHFRWKRTGSMLLWFWIVCFCGFSHWCVFLVPPRLYCRLPAYTIIRSQLTYFIQKLRKRSKNCWKWALLRMYSDTSGSQTAFGKLSEAGWGPCSVISNKIKPNISERTKWTEQLTFDIWRTIQIKLCTVCV